MKPSDAKMEVANLPNLPEGSHRILYWDSISGLDRAAAAAKGYFCVTLVEMPQSTEEDQRRQVEAFMQGVTDGTIVATQNRIRGVELRAKSLRMLDSKEQPKTPSKELPDTVQGLIDNIKGKVDKTLHDAASIIKEEDILAKMQGKRKGEDLPRGKRVHVRKVEKEEK